MADIFDVIADPTRRDLLHELQVRLATPGPAGGELSVGELVDALKLTQPTVSKHLKVLRDHGLVTVREDGQHRYYRLDSGPLGEIENWLSGYLDSGSLVRTSEADAAVFSAWAGADVGETIGRRIAEGSHQARTVIHDASERVVSRLPAPLRRKSGPSS
jgi:DNA-binding transcriptional ArsR family regulator